MSLLEASRLLGIPLSIDEEYTESNDYDEYFDNGEEEWDILANCQ